MQPIKNIIFDLGGIFLNIEYELTEKAFIDMGVTQFSEMYNQHHSNDLFELLETGSMSEEAFYDAFRLQSNTSLTNEQIKTGWNALLLDFPQERLEWLQKIRQKYNIYLFSNTNIIHYDAFIEKLKKENLCTNFNQLFIKAYYSHELGLRKPYVTSYLKILEEQNLLASETVFIDDTAKNIEGAHKAGMQTIHLVAPMTLLDLGL